MNGICELCGCEDLDVTIVLYKGKRIYACENCIRKYNLVKITKSSGVSKVFQRSKVGDYNRRYHTIKSTHVMRSPYNDEYNLVNNFGVKIKNAREALGLTQEGLAKKLKIKVSLIKKIEAEKWLPPPELAKRIEKALNIVITNRRSEEIFYPKEFLRKKRDQFKLGDYL